MTDKKQKKQRKQPDYNKIFADQLRAIGFAIKGDPDSGSKPLWSREYHFHSRRGWAFDFAFPELKIAIEIEGGIWSGGRHVTPTGFIKDCEKYNKAAMAGWTLLRYTPGQIRSGSACREVFLYIQYRRQSK